MTPEEERMEYRWAEQEAEALEAEEASPEAEAYAERQASYRETVGRL